MMIERPACWTWPVTEAEHERVFLAAGSARRAALPLIEDWQAGRCAVCGYGRGRLEADHCHNTGLFRGFLCHSCNVQEAHAGAGRPVFSRYRRRHPAAILGLSIHWAAPEPPAASAEELLRHMAATDPLLRKR